MGRAPLCEASAALPAPWDPDTILVADNEIPGTLFAFRIRGDLLTGQESLAVPGGKYPADVEALAADGDRLIVVGSCSRNSQCEPRPRRDRISFYRWNRARSRLEANGSINAARSIGAAASGDGACLSSLFTSPPPPLAAEFCRAFVRAESAAKRKEGPCSTLNIEGAATLPPAAGGASRIWLGLRSPLVDGAAVTLRLAPGLKELRFDAVALLDLDARGVRDLALRDGMLWGIAGRPEDSSEGFALWRIPLRSLEPGARVRAEAPSRALPAGAEGLVLAGDRAIVVFDVDRTGEGAGCASRQLSLSIEPLH